MFEKIQNFENKMKGKLKTEWTEELMSSRRMQFFILLSFAFVLRTIFFLPSKEIFILIWIFDVRQSKLNLIEFNDFTGFFLGMADRDGMSEKNAFSFIWTLNKRGTWAWLVVIRMNLFMVCSWFMGALLISYHFQLEILRLESWNVIWFAETSFNMYESCFNQRCTVHCFIPVIRKKKILPKPFRNWTEMKTNRTQLSAIGIGTFAIPTKEDIWYAMHADNWKRTTKSQNEQNIDRHRDDLK